MAKFNLGLGASKVNGRQKGEKGKPKDYARMTLAFDTKTGWFLIFYPSQKGVDWLNENCFDKVRNAPVTTVEMEDDFTELTFSPKTGVGETYKLRTGDGHLPKFQVPLYGIEPVDPSISIKEEQCESWIKDGALHLCVVRRLKFKKIDQPKIKLAK